MKAEEFLKSKYYIPNSFAYGRDLEMVLDEYGGETFLIGILEEYAKLKCKELRHKAAEIAISDIPDDIKHSKIMNIRIEI